MSKLFVHEHIHIKSFKLDYGLDISPSFISCANTQLTILFVQHTGLTTFGKNLSMAWEDAEAFKYQKGEVSKLTFRLFVNYNWNDIWVCWKSKSGKIYDINDAEIDCNDIEFWFEGLNPVLYHQQLYPNEQLPFKLKNLTYELVVVRLNMDANLLFTFKEKALPTITEWLKEIDALIQKFINKPIRWGKGNGGVVHNYKRKQVAANQWEYEIDTGSAGIYFYKKLLPLLSEFDCLAKVEIQ